MTRPHPIERHAINDAATYCEIAARIPQVLANLADNLPDSPGSAGGGGGKNWIGDPTGNAAITGTLTDGAIVDWTELQRLDRALHPLLRRYLDLTSRWMFIPHEGGNQRHARPTTDEDWCRSCLRIDWFCPRSRGDLCRWCRDFKATEGDLPPIEILHARRDGKTITETMVRDAKRQAKMKRHKARR